MIYLHDWADGGLKAMRNDFGISDSDLDGCEIICASYTYENYSGSAWVLFRKDGKLFEVNGGHCSCYGLEDQWVPEETSLDALRMRSVNYADGALRVALENLSA